MPTPLARLLILPALAALLALTLTASPASAVFTPPPVDCPCWDDGGPFYTPAQCFAPGNTRFGFVSGTFAQTVNYGAVSYCRNNALFRWTSAAEHTACNVALHLACSDILAVAYIDRNNNDVFDGPDGLIAKLVDTNGNGTANAGDATVLHEYPATPSSTATGGSFAVKAVPCNAATLTAFTPTSLQATCTGANIFPSWQALSDRELFWDFSSTIPIMEDRDTLPSCNDEVFVEPGPWMPSTTVDVFFCQPGDQNFLDVDIFVPPAPAPAPPP